MEKARTTGKAKRAPAPEVESLYDDDLMEGLVGRLIVAGDFDTLHKLFPYIRSFDPPMRRPELPDEHEPSEWRWG